MRTFPRLIAFVLAALWLPAVWHCGMESLSAAGEEQECCSHESSESKASAGACVADHCGVFDDGHFRPDGEMEMAVPVPSILGAVILELWHATASGPDKGELDTAPGASPPEEVARSWMFALRAASWANAPGVKVG